MGSCCSRHSCDLVGYRQQPERRYEVLTMDEQRLLAARLREVVVPF
ncbi:MAG: hypothetical protein ACFB14_06965 [Leptolyngbyaceae cyanobacterium]